MYWGESDDRGKKDRFLVRKLSGFFVSFGVIGRL